MLCLDNTILDIQVFIWPSDASYAITDNLTMRSGSPLGPGHDSESSSGVKRKASALGEGCGRGATCTCAICKRAREKKVSLVILLACTMLDALYVSDKR